MISNFFIERPIFASVISILIILAGLVSLKNLPIEQYPNITPPQIQVAATYTGADASTVAQNVASPIEQQVNGVEDMIYMYSQNSASGSMVLNVFFEIGSNADMAQVNVQNRVNLALPIIPEEVQKVGVSVNKQTPTILLIISVQSPDGSLDNIFVSNYTTINIVDELLRIPGVSNATIIGPRNYSMRVWLKPDRMAQLAITTSDVVNAIREQNQQFAIGQIGQAPTVGPVVLTIPLISKGRLTTPEEFDNIILRAKPDGSMVLIKDIGHTELGAQDYTVNAQLDGKTTTAIAIYQQFGANALDVADDVKATMKRLEKNFPAGLAYTIPYDTTMFIKASISEVVKTIFEAGFLVIIVVYIFLQNIRATLVPVLALIVSIIGTFAGMYLLGFSLNTLTLFGLVLAIGIVVDDAIVVIENVERNIQEGLSAKEAAVKAMEEVSGPVIAIVFVLCAVFVPVAFLGGIAGQLYRQFAITIAISVVFSGIVALTLSPAMAAILLSKKTEPTRFARWFNRHFDKFTHYYTVGAKWLIHRTFIGLAAFALLICCLLYLANTIPTSFVPQEDQGYLMAIASLPDGASLDRTTAVDNQIFQIAKQNPAVEHFVSLSGFSMLDNLNRTTVGTNFIILKDWSQRTAANMHIKPIFLSFYQQFIAIKEAIVAVFNPPAIQGLGTVGGFEFWIENRGTRGIQALEENLEKFMAAASKRPEIQGLTNNLEANNMLLYVDLDRFKTRTFGVSISEVYETLQVLLGSLYVNNFNKYGWTYQVTAQAEPSYRTTIDDLGQMYVRSKNSTQMVPLGSLVTFRWERGPTLVSHFNGFQAVRLNGAASPGYSSGQAMDAMEEVAKDILPYDMTYSWGGESYQEKKTGGTSLNVLLAGIVVVFLILAALYEKWALPLAIILAVPFGIFGAFLAIYVMGISNDVYFQIGLVTLIALSAKNAILIVEFAVLKREQGMGIIDAALDAARLRFRAILMTSLTFIFGVIPLVTSSGAGANARHSVGTGVMGGMISATIFAVFFVPLFYKIISQISERKKKKELETRETHG